MSFTTFYWSQLENQFEENFSHKPWAEAWSSWICSNNVYETQHKIIPKYHAIMKYVHVRLAQFIKADLPWETICSRSFIRRNMSSWHDAGVLTGGRGTDKNNVNCSHECYTPLKCFMFSHTNRSLSFDIEIATCSNLQSKIPCSIQIFSFQSSFVEKEKYDIAHSNFF